MAQESAPYAAFIASERRPISSGPTPRPIKLLISRKLAEAVDRIGRGTRCWTAVVTGPNHRMLTALPTNSSGQATHRLGAKSPNPHAGAETIHAMAGSFAYQAWSMSPRRSASQPPANTPAHPPISKEEATNWARSSSPRPKLRSEPRESKAPDHSRTASLKRRRKRAARTLACGPAIVKTLTSWRWPRAAVSHGHDPERRAGV